MTHVPIPTRPSPVLLPNGRVLDTWTAGPGAGTPLLFIPGTPDAGLPYVPMVEQLAERGLRYVSFSRAGYGSSTRSPDRSVADVVDDARAVLASIGAESAWVVGWSGGGPHALACAALLPDEVLGTALIGSVAPYPAEGLDWFADMGDENVEEFRAALEDPEALIAFVERSWPIYRDMTGSQVAGALGDLVDDVDRGSIRDEFAEWLGALWHEGLRESYWGWFDDDLAFAKPWGFDLGAIQGPVHIWQGRHDRFVPFSHGEWLAKHVGGACPHLLDEHGHLTLIVDSMPAILDELIS